MKWIFVISKSDADEYIYALPEIKLVTHLWRNPADHLLRLLSIVSSHSEIYQEYEKIQQICLKQLLIVIFGLRIYEDWDWFKYFYKNIRMGKSFVEIESITSKGEQVYKNSKMLFFFFFRNWIIIWYYIVY